MIIALDYDQTYTADPEMWKKFIELAKQSGHEIICLTMRFWPGEQILDFPGTVIYTNRKAKLIYAKKNNIKVDIWIDDKPGWLFDDAADAA